MFRILSVVLMGCFLFVSESMAMDDDSKSLFLTPKKRKIEDEENNYLESNFSSNVTPTRAEQNFFSPIKRTLSLKLYKNGEKKSMATPEVRRTFAAFDNGTHFSGETRLRGRRILQTSLYNPNALVLHEGQWITNLQRMEMGFTPIGRKGILREAARKQLTEDKIYTIQNRNRIELHHITQRDVGEENPIVEMTRFAHHGSNTRLILERDPVSGSTRVVHSRLEKEQVEVLLENHQFSVSNVLHFRDGPSLINREEWNEVRSEYWKTRAEAIKQGKGAPPLGTKFFLFKDPSDPLFMVS